MSLLTCPNCGVRYAVDVQAWPTVAGEDSMVMLKPRQVRCKVCQEVWAAVPEEDVAVLEEPLPPAPPPVPPKSDYVSRAAEARAAVEEQEREAALAAEAAALRRPRPWGWIFGMALVALLAGGAGLWIGQGRPIPALALPDIGNLQDIRFELPQIDLGRWGLASISLPRVEIPVIRVPAPPPSQLGVKADAGIRSLADGRRIWEISGEISNSTASSQSVPPIEISLLDDGGAVVARWQMALPVQRIAAGQTQRFETSAIDPPPTAKRLKVELKQPALARM